MPKCGQFYDTTTGEWTQLPTGGLTTADITVSGVLCITFDTIKDSDDNLYILAYTSISPYVQCIIKLTKSGIKTKTILSGGSFYFSTPRLKISRNKSMLLFGFNSFPHKRGILSVNIADLIDGTTIVPDEFFNTTQIGYTLPWEIYKDLYIWQLDGDGDLLNIYDYTAKTAILGYPLSIIQSLCTCCSSTNILYSASAGKLQVVTLDNSTLHVATIDCAGITASTKQMLIDPFGDLIILTNSGTASTLLKYTVTGVLIDTKSLANPSYNLNIDTKGNYYYQTALATFKIDKNTAQGQAFDSVVTKIRDTGNTGYGSNMTGYQLSVYN